MIQIQFHDAVGCHGMFSTVRKGDRYMRELKPGDEVELLDKMGGVIGYATVADGWLGDLARVPASIVEMEASYLHRSYSGLIMGLRAHYGDPVKPDMPVTALILNFKGKTNLVVPRG